MNSDRFAFILLFLLLVAVGCAPKLDESLLAQKWRMTSFESDQMNADELDSQAFMFRKLVFEFTADHHFVQLIEAEKTTDGTWEAKGDKLILHASNPEVKYPEYQVMSLTDSTLTLQSVDAKGRLATVGYQAIPQK